MSAYVEKHQTRSTEAARIREAELQNQHVREQLHEQEKIRLQELLKEAHAFRDFVALTDYIHYLEQRAAHHLKNVGDQGFLQRMTELRQLAISLDFSDKRIAKMMEVVSQDAARSAPASSHGG